MQIDKIMIVESPVHLWKILETKEEIIDQSVNNVFYSLRLFMDSVSNYINGCKCLEEENYTEMMENYALIQTEEIVSRLVEGLECDKIEFK
jgi:hypothetical protein